MRWKTMLEYLHIDALASSFCCAADLLSAALLFMFI
jgi:hypothetical protein